MCLFVLFCFKMIFVLSLWPWDTYKQQSISKCVQCVWLILFSRENHSFCVFKCAKSKEHIGFHGNIWFVYFWIVLMQIKCWNKPELNVWVYVKKNNENSQHFIFIQQYNDKNRYILFISSGIYLFCYRTATVWLFFSDYLPYVFFIEK